MEVVSTFQKNLNFFLRKMEFDMTNRALIHLIKMAQPSDIGEPFLKWVNAFWHKEMLVKNSGLIQ